MIDRYSKEEMRDIFSKQSKYDAWLKVEIATLRAFSKLGVIPFKDVNKIEDKAKFTIDRIEEIEQETRHDVVAFTRTVSESLGDEKKWVHYGLTSTDVVDTANGIIYKRANDILFDDLLKLKEVLRTQALKYKNTPCMGRTHGIHAEITSFGLKWALWYDELNRNIKRFTTARKDVECGKISGAVGNFANTPPTVQDDVCEQLGLESASISTQTLQRDRHAHYGSVLTLIGSTIEKIALEIRHLQRTEVREVEEYFRKGQKGSSAMPHKRNPIASENITGCARMLRGYMVTLFEDIPLWHERDISHSSVERVVLPDAIMLLDYMLKRYMKVLETLTVFEGRMKENIYLTNGVIFSQRVMTQLIEGGLSREEAYDLVQPLAMKAFNHNKDFIQLIKDNREINKVLSQKAIQESFDINYFLKNVDRIYQRVGISE
ncbi:MAG: adenylosuccinate lyase [Candidatus Izemoplasma sp.]|nr:adenylosuccinate lyase [Candidatus Izemoplasma sp.]